MKRNAKVQKIMKDCKGPLTPNATVLFDAIQQEAHKYKAIWNGGTKFQVAGPWMDQCVVDMEDKTCSCRKWELTGMPCKHAVAAFYNMKDNEQEVRIPESYVHPVYWLKTWKKVYSFAISPIKGRAYWPICNSPMIILPPKHKVAIGRPKKKRRRSQTELQLVKEGKLTRAAANKKCGNCNQDGHNKRTCPKVPTQQPSGSKSKAATKQASKSKSKAAKVGNKTAAK